MQHVASSSLQGVAREHTLFSTGTDEHGLKIQQSAEAGGRNVQEFCDTISQEFRSLFVSADVSFNKFMRTSEEKHCATVQQMFRALGDGGHLYRGRYQGWYCLADESFLGEGQVREEQLPSGLTAMVSAESGRPVEWHSEDNYMFRMSAFSGELLHWLRAEGRVRPQRYQRQLEQWVSEELPDLSVSRPRERVPWGVSVPGDEDHTVYVWVDALANYLTAAGGLPIPKPWPPDVQVLGKDILRFHGLCWPSLLMALDLEPPRALLCHGHWTVGGQKMSKSLGNVVNPREAAAQYTTEGLRYLLLRGGAPHADSPWGGAGAGRILNAELAGTLGNLLSRCTAPALNPQGQIASLDSGLLESSPSGQQLAQHLATLPETVAGHYTDFNFHHGIEAIMGVIRQANAFVQEEQPWILAKDAASRPRLELVLRLSFEVLRMAGVTLMPVVPGLSTRLLDALGVPLPLRTWPSLALGFTQPQQNYLSTSFALGPRHKLFPRLKLEE
ncbi:Methionine--tRNA ligase, mitochondrial [Chionoecetes opilio]|uniref:Methionine--tRNA ligase, mitochondrial n=1 Tax=Chionoecetes opilio TaxID=41210 RepID=A0A8J4Y6J9_CHIOP|nr:Methionine--tRNA ligase, mitochondrial [Chionoecetes opilio]